MNPYRILAAVLCIAVLFLGAGILFGAEPLIDAPEKVAPYKFVDAKVVGDFESAIWTVEPEDAVDLRPSSDGKTLTWVAPPGVYVIRLVAVNFTAKKIVQGKKSVTIGTPEPPVPPVPPVPPPPPPVPPIPQAGLRVLIIEKQAARGSLPKGQQDILTATAPDSPVGYMMANCVKGPDGVTPDYRIADEGSDFSRDVPLWKAARAKFSELKVPIPGWLVSNGTTGIGGPLPATPTEAVQVLQQHTPKGN